MSETFKRVVELASRAEIRVSSHGYDELAADRLAARDLIGGLAGAKVVEDYPDYPKGPCVLVLQRDWDGQPVHVIWGIPKGKPGPAVLVTAYRPDPERWSGDFMTRRKQ